MSCICEETCLNLLISLLKLIRLEEHLIAVNTKVSAIDFLDVHVWDIRVIICVQYFVGGFNVNRCIKLTKFINYEFRIKKVKDVVIHSFMSKFKNGCILKSALKMRNVAYTFGKIAKISSIYRR